MSDDGPHTIADARAVLERNGFVVLKEKSYKAAQERQRIAEARRQWAVDDQERSRAWAVDCLRTERRLHHRCELLWGLAVKHGATLDDLSELNAAVDVWGASDSAGKAL